MAAHRQAYEGQLLALYKKKTFGGQVYWNPFKEVKARKKSPITENRGLYMYTLASTFLPYDFMNKDVCKIYNMSQT